MKGFIPIAASKTRPNFQNDDVLDITCRWDEEGPAMTAQQTLIDELESAIASKSIGSRAEMLRRITALFTAGSSELSAEQLALFDDVMSRFVEQIERSARAALGLQLIAVSKGPP